MADQQLVQYSTATYANPSTLAAETDVLPLGTTVLCLTGAFFQATQTLPASGLQYVTSTGVNNAGATITTYWVQASGVQRFSVTFALAALQALTSGTAFNVGPVLPANARVLGTEVVVNTALAGNTSDVITVQGGSDTAGSMFPSTTIFTGAKPVNAGAGSNPYMSRGAQQIQATITGGAALINLTAGNITINLYMAVTQ